MSKRTGLGIVEPVSMTDAMLLGTDVPETDYAPYAAGTTYAKDAFTLIVATHKVYQSLQAGNLGHDPATSPTWWIEVGYDNRWRLFDGKIGSKTAQPWAMYYRLAPGIAITSMVFLNLEDVLTIRVRAIDPVDGTVFDETADVGPTPRNADIWEFTYGVWTLGRKKHLLSDLPSYPNAELRIDLVGGAGLAVGSLLIGQAVYFGDGVKLGLRLGIKDYSQKTRDQWGNLDITPGGSTDRNNFDLSLPNQEIDALKDYLETILSKKCVFIVCGLYMATIVYGIYNNFEIVIPYQVTSDCNFDLEGLT